MLEFFRKVHKLKPVYDVIYKIFLQICKILLIADLCITTWMVLCRYITVFPAPNWGEEVILTLMSYMAVLSAALAIRRNAHIRMTSLDRYLPPKVVHISDVICDVVVFILAVIMIVYGFKYAFTIGMKAKYTSMPSVSSVWKYLPIPVAGIAMIFFEVERIFIDLAAVFGYRITTGMANENIEELPAETGENALKEVTEK